MECGLKPVMIMDDDRHDCGDPDCPDYRRQQIVDALQIVADGAFNAERLGLAPGPLEAIEHGVAAFRGFVTHDEEIGQAQRAIEDGATVH